MAVYSEADNFMCVAWSSVGSFPHWLLCLWFTADKWLQLLCLHWWREICWGFLSCWGLGILIICGWFRASLHKKLSLNAWGNSWLDGSRLHTWPCNQLCCWLDLFFFCLTVIVLLSICSQVNGVPAAFTHCEYRLQAYTVATVWLCSQRTGI